MKNLLEVKENSLRVTIALLSLIISVLWIVALNVILPSDGEGIRLIDVLIDSGNSMYPFTIQNLMWIVFFFGAGELWLRYQRTSAESDQLAKNVLPEDEETLLRAKDLGAILMAIKTKGTQRIFALQNIVTRTIVQFRLNGSVAQADSILNTSLDLMHAELDLKYNMLRYITWLLPTLGFIGTVVGISMALSEAGNMPDVGDGEAIKAWMGVLTAKLGIAFNTTLLALLQSAVLIFAMHVVQAREEESINHIGRYCLNNLINRLYEE